VLLYFGFVLYPLVQALILSLYKFRGVSRKRTFIGAGNFQTLLSDQIFVKSALHNVLLFAGSSIVIISAAVFLAHLLRAGGRAAKLARAVYLFPQIISLVVVAVLWQFILNPKGLLNAGLESAGLGRYALAWLGNGKWSLTAIGVTFVWWALGFYLMLFEAGLKQIPSEVNEAAELDGSTGLHRFALVTWPLLWSIKRIAVIYLVINTMNVFALAFLMTRGGPDRASEVMLTYLYEQAFANSSFGYATAVAVGNFVIVLVLTAAVGFAFRKNPAEGRR
jgi:N-acetylglucosamine transport system permease protein